jgi:hypothetical protein
MSIGWSNFHGAMIELQRLQSVFGYARVIARV